MSGVLVWTVIIKDIINLPFDIIDGYDAFHESGAGFGNKIIWHLFISFWVNSLSSSFSFSLGQMTSSLLEDSSSIASFSSSFYSSLIMSSYASLQLFIHFRYWRCSCFYYSLSCSSLLLCSVVKGLRIVNIFGLLRGSVVFVGFVDITSL